MRKIYLLRFFVSLVIFLPITSKAQTINLLSLGESQKHIFNLNFGWDYSLAYGLGYSYLLNTKHPIFISSSITVPLGEDLFDDFRSKIGIQPQVFKMNNFIVFGSLQGTFIRFETPLVRMVNLGYEINPKIGFFKPSWFTAIEFSMEMPVNTNIKHSHLYKENFAQVKDGWYGNEINGNLKYGLVTGFSLPKYDFLLSMGKTIYLDFNSNPFVPYYMRIGFNVKV